nr:hypothetical protein [Treponema pedis]
MKKINCTKNVLEAWYGNHLVLILESLIVGLLTGIVITAFRKSIDIVSLLRETIYGSINYKNIFTVLIPITAVIILGLFMGFLIKKISYDKRERSFSNKGELYEKTCFIRLA